MSSKQQQLDELRASMAKCSACDQIAPHRKNIVFGEGNPDAEIMFIGEAPGAEEDESGRPFVGRAGKKLREIIKGLDWLESDIYIANILKCRPPNNRVPAAAEVFECESFLRRQIDIIAPRFIICWGATAAFHILKPDIEFKFFKIGERRQQVFSKYGAKVFCTYHPSYVLRNPDHGQPAVRDDMRFFRQQTGIEVGYRFKGKS